MTNMISKESITTADRSGRSEVDWIALYQQWVNTSRLAEYEKRIEAARQGLFKDMELWTQTIDHAETWNELLSHHLTQFRNFVAQVYDILIVPEQQNSTAPQNDLTKLTAETERDDFRALVIGVLTAQWNLLRSVVGQRVTGSPYIPKFLFELGLEFAAGLDSAAGREQPTITPELSQAFNQLGVALSGQAPALQVDKSGSSWTIVDNGKVYSILSTGQKLRVYDGSGGLYALDNDARAYYFRLRHALDPILAASSQKLNSRYRDNPLVDFAPIVYLGELAELSVFNRRTPLMVSVPFGALPGTPDSEKARMAIAHEVAHAVFEQVPELINELKRTLKDRFDQTNPTRQQQVLNTMALNWTDEICADLFGTALGGGEFASSALWIMASSESTLGFADETHPPAIMRPIIHLLALAKIEQDPQTFYNVRVELQDQIAKADPNTRLLSRQFKSIPALMFVKLETVSALLTEFVQAILEQPLTILGDSTFGDLLTGISNAPFELPTDLKPEDWGEIPDRLRKDFVLDFPPEALAPAFATPGVSGHPICCYISFLKEICC